MLSTNASFSDFSVIQDELKVQQISASGQHSPITLLCYHLPSEVCNVAWSEILGGKQFSCNMSCVLVVTNKSAPAVDVGENSTYSYNRFFFLLISAVIFSSLCQAASFGESFLTDMPPHAFVSMCRNLRVLNAVRDYMVGIPLTYGQYPLS